MRRASCFWLFVLTFSGQASQRNLVSAAEAVPPFSSSSALFSRQDKSWSRASASVLSDFDGDGTPDLAVGTFDGRNYNIEIRLSTQRASRLLGSGQTGPGTCLVVRDVDSDNDQDLILIDYTSLLPLAVWLNDGKANFKEGSRWSCLHLITTDSTSSVDPESFSVSAIHLTEDYPLPFNRFAVWFLGPKLQPRNSIGHESQTLRSLLFPCHPSPRGPPVNS